MRTIAPWFSAFTRAMPIAAHAATGAPTRSPSFRPPRIPSPGVLRNNAGAGGFRCVSFENYARLDSVDNRTLWPDLAIMFEMALRNNDADTWFAFPKSVTRLLELLATRKATMFLAGDVHYSYVFDVEFSPTGATSKKNARLIHAVSSPMQHEMDAPTLAALTSYADEIYRDASGDIANQFGDPGTNPLRDQFKLPLEAFAAFEGPREILDGAYSTRNLVATMELTTSGSLILKWLAEPVVSGTGRLTEVGELRPKKKVR